MPERIYKLQPNRTIQLRGFSDLGASAALHSATANGFKVSGIFRDPADFCVLILYDCDNFYEHPSLKYLPDTNFDGLTLDFDVHYTGLRNLDSPRYWTIDWPFLDVICPDGTKPQVKLFKLATQASGTWTAASAQFTIVDNAFEQWDHLTLWYLNQAFDFVVPQLTAPYAFTSQGAGTVHYISVADQKFTYTEQNGDTNATIVQALLGQLSASSHVSASYQANQINLTALKSDGSAIQTSASSNPTGYTIYATSAQSIAANLASQCNKVDWTAAGADIPITAQANGATITFAASTPGVDGNALSMYAVTKGTLTTDVQFRQFAGGSSDATWHVSIDFTKCCIPQIRQMWLTFAPPLACGAAFTDTEWEATFTNWNLSGPEDVKRLQVAGPGSLRIDNSSTVCTYNPKVNWLPEAGYYQNGYATVSSAAGNTVTIRYDSAVIHDLWIGTSLYSDRGSAGVQIDGGTEIEFNTYLDTGLDSAVITRRLAASSVPAGSHTITICTKDAKPFYFDYLDLVVPSDVPDNRDARTNISPALDYSTDHSYKLPPARILWMFDKLGFGGPVNQYIGVFWWNQRVRKNAQIPQATITFSDGFENADQIWLTVSGTKIGKSVLANDTSSTIAQHFACYVNETFVGLWASATANVLTLTSYSPTANFQFDLSVNATSAGTGTATVSGALKLSVTPLPVGEWYVDPSQSPALNRGAREWEADLFNECQARNRELVVASSMELVQPPDEFPARYQDGTAVKTDVGYGSSWWSSQCAFNSVMLAYQQQVFDCIAGMMTAAGLVPNLQFGEYCWWYFASNGSMAFYDADTQAAAQTALGRPLGLFVSPLDDPASVNSGADATFLRNRLRDHVAALIAYIRGKYPNAKFEVLFPYDVNYPVPSGVNKLGGALLRFVNFPVEWGTKPTAGFDRLKMEGLDWGSASRNLELVQAVMEFPIQQGWPLDSIRYMLPIFNGGCPWISEYRMAKGLKIPVINLWAFDHVCIFGLPVAEPARPPRAVRF